MNSYIKCNVVCDSAYVYNVIGVHLTSSLRCGSGSECNGDSKDKERSESSPAAGNKPLGGHGLGSVLQFWFLTGLLSLVGPRVSSLVVLEFSLRAVAAWITAGPVRHTQTRTHQHSVFYIVFLVPFVDMVHLCYFCVLFWGRWSFIVL